MAADPSTVEGAPPATLVQDQDINPWSVEGAQGADGEVAAINYEALSQYVLSSSAFLPSAP